MQKYKAGIPRRFLAIFIAAVMMLTLMPVISVPVKAATVITFAPAPAEGATFDGTEAKTFNITQNTVVTGTVTDATHTLTLNIASGVTVTWQAVYESTANNVISLQGSGTFTVIGGKIAYTGLTGGDASSAIYVQTGYTVTINIQDGIISSNTAKVIDVSDVVNTLTVSGGTITGGGGDLLGNGAVIRAGGSGTVTVSGGIVRATGSSFGTAIGTTGAMVTVSDAGTVISNGFADAACAIGVHSGSPVVNVNGGTVRQEGRGRAILISAGTPTVTISGGTVEATGDFNNIAVHAVSEGGIINISGTAKVQQTTVGAGQSFAIRLNNDATLAISGGIVSSAGPEPAISAGTASSAITISGGLVFSYGNTIYAENINGRALNSVISTPSGGFNPTAAITAPGAVIVWDRTTWFNHIRTAAPHNHYIHGTNEGLRALPLIVVNPTWTGNNTITYAGGTISLTESETVRVSSTKIPVVSGNFGLRNSANDPIPPNPVYDEPNPQGSVVSTFQRFIAYNTQFEGDLFTTLYTDVNHPPNYNDANPPIDAGDYSVTVTIASNNVFSGGPFIYTFSILDFAVKDIVDPPAFTVGNIPVLILKVGDDLADIDAHKPEPHDPNGVLDGNEAKGWEWSSNGTSGWGPFSTVGEAAPSDNGIFLRYRISTDTIDQFSNVARLRVYSVNAQEFTVGVEGCAILEITVGIGNNMVKYTLDENSLPMPFTFYAEPNEKIEIIITCGWFGGSSCSLCVFVIYSGSDPLAPPFSPTICQTGDDPCTTCFGACWDADRDDDEDKVLLYKQQFGDVTVKGRVCAGCLPAKYVFNCNLNHRRGSESYDPPVIPPPTTQPAPGPQTPATTRPFTLTIDANGNAVLTLTESFLDTLLLDSEDGVMLFVIEGDIAKLEMAVPLKWFMENLGATLLVYNEGLGLLAITSENLIELAALAYKGEEGGVSITIHGKEVTFNPDTMISYIMEKGSVILSVTADGNPLDWYIYDSPIILGMPENSEENDEDLEINPDLLVAVKIFADGSEKTIPRSILNGGLVYAMVNSEGTFEIRYNPVSFTDTIGKWMCTAVNFMAARKIVLGIGNNLFAPERSVTRAEYLAMLMRMMDYEMTDYDPDPFIDVTPGDWYYESVGKAAALGITAGIGNGLFGPGLEITRQDMFTMTYNALVRFYLLSQNESEEDYTLDVFSDVDMIAGYALSAMKELVNSGLVNGSDGLLKPRNISTRAEAAQFLTNVIRYIIPDYSALLKNL
jgi:hypothetical protein